MVAKPLIEEISARPATPVPMAAEQSAALQAATQGRQPLRRLSIYQAAAGFSLVDELDFLSARTIEPNLFFNPRFLAPAMPRLEDREVRLAVIRDGGEEKSRLRLLVPFSVERPATPLGVPVMRSWANPFGPLGTPLLDRDDPAGVVTDFFEMLSRPHLSLPKVLVLPDMRLEGPVATMLTAVATARGLPIEITSVVERPFLESTLDGEAYLKNSLSPHHYREFRRMKRRLSEKGRLEHVVARSEDDVRNGLETFLALEAAGWKGRKRTAMAIDRFQAAFAREAVNRLAERDLCRIHLLTLDGEPVASLVAFIEAGMAYTWKTAYDEAHAAYSPGTLLMIEVTKQHLADPQIDATDSCAVPDHQVMSRIWTERRKMGTIVIGMTESAERQVRQAASQLHLDRETRNFARTLRDRFRRLLRIEKG